MYPAMPQIIPAVYEERIFGKVRHKETHKVKLSVPLVKVGADRIVDLNPYVDDMAKNNVEILYFDPMIFGVDYCRGYFYFNSIRDALCFKLTHGGKLK